MALGKRLINTGVAEAACLTETTDIFGDSSGVALYNLDSDASTAPDGTDYSGTPTNVDFGVGGQVNYGARFNSSSSSKIVLPTLSSDFVGANSRSVSAWVKITSTPSASLCIFNSGDNVSLQSFGYFIGTSRQVIISYYNRNWETSETISLDTWNHILFTYNGGAVENSSNSKIYINGTLATLGSDTGSATGSANTPNANHAIGVYNATSQYFFNGSIDQVRLFSKALSSDEVSTLYAETACVYDATTTDNYYPLADGDTDAVAYYKLDNSSEDYVGTNDGTDTNIEYRFGRFGQAAVFNGTNSVIDTNFTSNTGDFSCSLWSNITDDNTRSALFSLHSGSGATSTVLYSPLSGSDGRWYFNSKNTNAFYGTSIKFGQWQHVVLTYQQSNTTFTLYIDGVSVGTSVSSIASGQKLLIGDVNTSGSSAAMKGLVDQVRIYSTALDSDQVAELYNEKPEVDTSNFKAVLYEGTSSKQYISNVGYNLDVDNGGDGGIVWVKARTGTARDHRNYDTIRGIYPIYPSRTLPEGVVFPIEYDANGFFFNGNEGGVNETGVDYVAWVWKGGGDAVSTNNNGGAQITADVSANTEAGFSLVKYTGSGTLNQKVYHGLDEAPEIVITKRTDASEDWFIFTTAIDGSHDYLVFDTDAKADSAITAPTIDYIHSRTSGNIINYCFHSVAGYSKIGSYNGSASTVTITTGFKPSFVMIKRTNSTKDWIIFDTKRSGGDQMNDYLVPNTNAIEAVNSAIEINAISTGFTAASGLWTGLNADGGEYIYMAFK